MVACRNSNVLKFNRTIERTTSLSFVWRSSYLSKIRKHSVTVVVVVVVLVVVVAVVVVVVILFMLLLPILLLPISSRI